MTTWFFLNSTLTCCVVQIDILYCTLIVYFFCTLQILCCCSCMPEPDIGNKVTVKLNPCLPVFIRVLLSDVYSYCICTSIFIVSMWLHE